MTHTVDGDIGILRSAMTGPVFTPDMPDYEIARRVWNADIDRRPAVIARCSSAADVAAAVGYAQAEGLEIAVRSGAHSMSGQSTVDHGLVVDLSGMRQVGVDPRAKRARVAGGALLSDVDGATQAHGLAVPAGVVGHTGVGGLTLGGGLGWLTRQAGATIDNLLSAEVVVADGRILRASPEENPDLFWAIRGGGGNFGVVTEFEFQLHDVGPIVEFGFFFWGLDQGAEALRSIRGVVAELPRSLNVIITAMNNPPAPFVPEEYHFAPGIVLMLTGFGGAEEHGNVVARIREVLPPVFDHVAPMPYVALQQMLDDGLAWGQHYYEKSSNVEDLSDGVIEVLTEHAPLRSSPTSLVILYRLDQAYSEVDEQTTAYSGTRRPQYSVFYFVTCPTPELLVADRAWARSLWEAMRPHSLGDGAYVNTMAEQEDYRVLAAYGQEKYDRLARIKGVYDPGNVFHRNINIKPA